MKKQIFLITAMILLPLALMAQVKLGEKMTNFTTLDQDGSEWVFKKQHGLQR